MGEDGRFLEEFWVFLLLVSCFLGNKTIEILDYLANKRGIFNVIFDYVRIGQISYFFKQIVIKLERSFFAENIFKLLSNETF